jgi:O-antigen/teichoic acid export membrane protein
MSILLPNLTLFSSSFGSHLVYIPKFVNRMGIVQRDALRTSIINYIGLGLGYINKVVLLIMFLSPEEVGLINLILGIGILFGQATSLGSVFATWKFFPFFQNKEKKNFGFLGLMMGVVILGILFFTSVYILLQNEIAYYYRDKSELFSDYALWVIPIGIGYVFYLLFDSYLKVMFINIVSVFAYELLLRLCISIIILLFGFNLISFSSFVAFHSLIYFLPALYLMVYTMKIGQFHVKLSSINITKRFRKIIVKFSLFSYLNTFGAIAVLTIDSIMISTMIGLEATGIYTTMIYLVSVLQVPYRSMLRIGSALVVKYWKEKNMVEMNKSYKQFSSVSLYIILLLFSLVWINRIEIFSILPIAYRAGISVFGFIMIGRIVDVYFGLNTLILSSSKKYRVDLIFTSVLFVGVFLLNLVFIPKYGIDGAAISTSIVILFYSFLRVGYVYWAFKLHPFEKSQFAIIAIFGIALFLLSYIPSHDNFDILWIIFKSIFLLIGTVLPIFIFKIEPNTNDYIVKVLQRLKIIQ